MTIITVLEKAYGSFSPQTFETMLLSMYEDLKVTVKFKGRITRDWVQIEVTGEDQSVALRLLDRDIGLAPISTEKVGKFSALRGKVINAGESISELRVDVGVFTPRACDAVIPLQHLRAQLADGKNLPLNRLIQLFCLTDFTPLHIKIVSDLDIEQGLWEAELSEDQLFHFSDWLGSNLDRLIVLGARRREVEDAVEKARHFRDVIEIETLGPLEHAILCKLGTDAVGLMPKLGPYLRLASLTPFSPRRIREELKW